MYSTKMHRLSGPAVFIGYLLLIPSLLGILLAIGTGILGVLASASAPETSKKAAAEKLASAGLDPSLINRVVTFDVSVSDVDITSLPEDQQRAVSEAQSQVISGTAATGVGLVTFGGGAVCFGVFCLISGLVGWILTMKKKVLQCSACRAVVNAS